MPDCAADFEDLLPFQPFEPISMSDNFSCDYQQQDEGSTIPTDLIDLEDFIDFDEDELIDSSFRSDYPRLLEELSLDGEDLLKVPPSIGGHISGQSTGNASIDINASSLEKALTDAVGDALSSCFADEYNADEMFIENLLQSSEEIFPGIDQDETLSTSNMVSSKHTLSNRTTGAITDSLTEVSLKVFTALNGSGNNDRDVTLNSKKRSNSFPQPGAPDPKRYISEIDVGQLQDDDENINDLHDRQSQPTASTDDISEMNISDSETARLLEVKDDERCSIYPAISESHETTENSDISAMTKQIADWKLAAQTAFDAARKIRAQMELEKFRADQAETTITQLTSHVRSKAARKRFEKITKMRRSQSLTQVAASSADVTSAGSSNDRSLAGDVLNAKTSDRKADSSTPKHPRKATGCRSSQINDRVRLALRAKVRSVNANTLHTAKDIVQEAEVLLKDLPVTTRLKTTDK